MKSKSGILRIKDGFQRGGSAVIDFARYPHDGDVVGDATIHEATEVGGYGRFDSTPAYLAHIREYTLEDKGSGRSELDRWTINTHTDGGERLHIIWATDEKRSKVEEIGFLAVGE